MYHNVLRPNDYHKIKTLHPTINNNNDEQLPMPIKTE